MAELLSQPQINFTLSGAMRGAPGSIGLTGLQGLPGVDGIDGINGQGVPVGGSAGQTLIKNSSTNYDTIWSSIVGQASVHLVSQVAHGFTVGKVVKVGGSSYSLGQANTASSVEIVGMVYSVPNADSFNVITDGWMSGLTGLTAGITYFVDPNTPGNIISTDPATLGVSGTYRMPVFVSDSTTSGYFHKYEAIQIGASSYGGVGGGASVTQNVVVATANYTTTDADDIVVQTFSTGTVTMHNPSTAKVKPYEINNATFGDITVYGSTINGTSSFVIPSGLTIRLLPVSNNYIII